VSHSGLSPPLPCNTHKRTHLAHTADIIMLTVPSHAQAWAVKRIAPFIDSSRAVCMGVMPGMGGFNWIAGQICQFHQLDNVILFGLKDVPFMCVLLFSPLLAS